MSGIPAERILAVVTTPEGPVRGPGGGLRPLAGKPLVAWSFELASTCRKLFARVLVATGEHEIGQLAHSHGLDVPFRLPQALAAENARRDAVLVHAVQTVEQRSGAPFDWICALDAGYPLLTREDLQAALSLALQGRCEQVQAVVQAQRNHPLNLERIERGRLQPYAGSGNRQVLDPARLRPIAYLPSDALRLVRRAPLLAGERPRGEATCPLELSEENALQASGALGSALAERALRRRFSPIRPGAAPLNPL